LNSAPLPGRLPASTQLDLPERAVSEIPKDLLYTEDHEYVKPAGAPGEVFIGVTDFAQGELGDIVFVELPKVGSDVTAGSSFGVIEAVKSVSELFAPVSGKVVAINERVAKEPELVSADPYGAGWLIEVEMSNDVEMSSLKDSAGYRDLIASLPE
jgi:glycine cleavage system H protein